jgi:hypothetical protein
MGIAWTSFDVTIPEPMHVIAGRLSEQVSAWGSLAGAAYSGSVWKDGFKVTPATWYRNSFKPVLCGEFLPAPKGTLVRVTMRLPYLLVALVFGIWCTLLSGSVAVVRSVIEGGASAWVLIAVAVTLLFPVALTLGSFWAEVPHRRAQITRVLSGA